jgi:hypothetical protein
MRTIAAPLLPVLHPRGRSGRTCNGQAVPLCLWEGPSACIAFGAVLYSDAHRGYTCAEGLGASIRGRAHAELGKQERKG